MRESSSSSMPEIREEAVVEALSEVVLDGAAGGGEWRVCVFGGGGEGWGGEGG